MDTKVSAIATFGDIVTIQINEDPADPDIIVEADAQRISSPSPLFKLRLNVQSKE